MFSCVVHFIVSLSVTLCEPAKDLPALPTGLEALSEMSLLRVSAEW